MAAVAPREGGQGSILSKRIPLNEYSASVSSRLEYQYAFDMAASWLGGFAGAVLAIASNPEFAKCVLDRAAGGVRFICEDERTEQHISALLQGGLPREVASDTCIVPTDHEGWGTDHRFSVAIWA